MVSLTSQVSVEETGGEGAMAFQEMVSPVSVQYHYTASGLSTVAL